MATELIQVDIISQLSSEKFVVQLVGIGADGAFDCVDATQALTSLIATNLVRREALVTPLVVVAMIAQR